ncbi:replication-relaxation family protein [uncultured Roseobacter sp.]|uniref:replication-relaxation family protein n=1 Tax=uncultured Roseobacter sp. TaxID=114847 RepID=UPI00261B846B|nr:replication-relaxation family protein [uncultured Roseobacter sp.]
MAQRLPSHRPYVHPTARELRWFAHIDRHGPQSSEFLFELTRDTHRCKDTSLRRLQALRAAGYLCLPPQQRQIAKADFNPYVYDLTPLGWDVLSYEKDLERNARPTGHWWHGYWVSAVSSAIEIEATRAGLEYIPAARILAIRNVGMAIPVGRHKLIPDQLFAIRYPDGYRAFALEVDRGTEPLRSSAARKSLQRSVGQYREALQQKMHHKHYGLKSNLAVFWVFTSFKRRSQFDKLLDGRDKQFMSQNIATQVPNYDGLRWSLNSIVSA